MDISLEIIIAPTLTFFIVQSIKLISDGIKGNYNIRSIMTTHGGMPSAHTAIVVSLTSMVGYSEGVSSGVFAVASILSLIVITDAMVLRRFINDQGLAVKQLIARIPEKERASYPVIHTGLQHTLPQVLVGALIGFTIATVIQVVY